MPPNSRHLATITSLAIERAAFSRPGPDGRMSATTAADVQSILEQLQSRGSGRGGLLGYAGDHQGGLWDEPAHPRESTAHDGKKPGEFAPGGEGGDGADADEHPDHKARLADSDDYYAAHAEWQQETAAARQAFDSEHADWQEAVDTHAKYETDHKAWDERDTQRTARKETVDEADPIGDAEKAIEATWEASPAPDWDFNQEDLVAHYRAQIAPFSSSFAKGWDEHFGAKGPVRAALSELGADDKGLAKFDRAAAKGRANLEKSAEKYKAAAGKYVDYQVRADAERAKLEEMDNPGDAPAEPTLPDPELDEPYREDFETDEEYGEAKESWEADTKQFNAAWDEYEKVAAKHEKAQAAYEKQETKAGAMEERASELASTMEEHKESLETAWTEALDSLKEEQGEIAEKLTATIEKEAEDDPEPDEVDEPGDEPEFEPPEAPDPNDFDPDEEPEEDEPDEEDEDEALQHQRRGALIPYGATPLQAGLMSLAEGVFELLARPSTAPVVHVAPAAAPVVHVNGPSPAQKEEEEPGVPKLFYRDPNGVMVAYDRERFLENTLEGLADTMTHLVEALSRPPPPPVIHFPEQPPPVVNVQPPVENPLAYAREKDMQATLDRLTEAIEEMVRANTRTRRRRLLRDADGEVTGSVEE